MTGGKISHTIALMRRYNPKEIEPKWQKIWADQKLYKAVDFDKRPKFVMLTEFPYPSGDGLHLGHVREYTLGDIMARRQRMAGKNVLYPMGYDAFGLPTENYAIKNKIAPQVATDQNISNFQEQFDSLGYSIDWERSFRTTDPSYYKWTQWLFLQFYKAGLAYQDEIAINWCPKCKTGLANEEVINGRHERCDTPVEKKSLKQWILKITEYADRLIDGLQTVDYPSRIADQQINWIGRSVGAEVDFKVDGAQEDITVFTTRPDTLFGATFMVLAPEHPLVKKITTTEQREAVDAYVKAAQAKSDIERQENKEKTGVFTGTYALNPVNNEKIPIWIADYVLTGYGTGAIMAVPAHDERDYEFAQKFHLPIVPVVAEDFGITRDNETYVEGAVVIGYDKETNEYLGLRNMKGTLWLVGGGKEAGEDFIENAKRELREETGYSTDEFVALGNPVYSHYYNKKKDSNRRSFAPAFLAILDAAHKGQHQREVHEDFEPEWFTYDELVREITKTGGGVEHWLEILRRAKISVEQGFTPYENCYAGEGVLFNSDSYNGLSSSDAREKIVKDLEAKGLGKEKVTFKLRDWVFSRQHYWGEPIPIIHCAKDGTVPVPDDQLPVELPAVDHYEPTDTGESPLAAIESWVNVQCPKCGGPAKRETDTMPNWAGSSWYYLRYYDAHNDQVFADSKKLDYWGMVDMYLGGMEHTTLHLLYSRFWHQFLYDQKLVPTPEPYAARRGQGIVLAEDGNKMSKSKGNVVNPSDIISQGYGADALRIGIVFLAPYDQTTAWKPDAVTGAFRFLQRYWTLTQEYLANTPAEMNDNIQLSTPIHRLIKDVSTELEHMRFNTAIAALMECLNELYKFKAESGFGDRKRWQFALTTFTQLLAPFAPHISEEVWSLLGQTGSVHQSSWPVHDEGLVIQQQITVVVQINGKVREQLKVSVETTQDELVAMAQQSPKISTHLVGKQIRKTVYVPQKLINFVI